MCSALPSQLYNNPQRPFCDRYCVGIGLAWRHKADTYCTDWLSELAFRFTDPATGLEDLAGPPIMATFLVMVGEKAQYRFEVLQFGKSGLAPTLEALKLKQRTLYHWRRQLRIAVRI